MKLPNAARGYASSACGWCWEMPVLSISKRSLRTRVSNPFYAELSNVNEISGTQLDLHFEPVCATESLDGHRLDTGLRRKWDPMDPCVETKSTESL